MMCSKMFSISVPAEVLTEAVNECLLDYEYTRQIFWDRMHATVSSAIMEVDESDNGEFLT